MNTVALRKKIIGQIESTENINLLNDIQKLLGIEGSKIEDAPYYHLNEGQKEAVLVAREEIKNGNYLTNEEANRDIDQWLNK
jgi:secreted Zn-dependent insulinase-like peptidase